MMMQRVHFWGMVSLLAMLLVPLGAGAQSTDCDDPTFVVPDGRLNSATIPNGAIFWFGLSSGQDPASYAVEADFPRAANQAPMLGVFAASDVGAGPTCSVGGSSVTTRAIAGLTPEAPNSERLSFQKTTGGPAVFLLRVENTTGSSQALTLRVAETTLLSPRWSTFGGFNTSWGFHNTTNTTVTVTLRVIRTTSEELATDTFALNAGQVVFRSALGLGIAGDRAGNAFLIHDGPPKAIQADGFMVSPDGQTGFPVKFEELRAAGPSGTGEGAAVGGGGVESVTAGDASIAIGGTVTNPTVALADLGISTAKLADASVTEVKLSFDPATQAELDAAMVSGWDLIGNAGTNPATNFLGTSDNVDFRIRTNNVVRATFDAAGNVGIGTTTPSEKLDVVGTGRFSASTSGSVSVLEVIQIATGLGANAAIRGVVPGTHFPTAGVVGETTESGGGVGVMGISPASGGTAIFGQSSGGAGTAILGQASGTGSTTGVRGTVAASGGGTGVKGEGGLFGVVGTSSASPGGVGVLGQAFLDAGTGVRGEGSSIGVRASASISGGFGVRATQTGLGGTGVQGLAGGSLGRGVHGEASATSGFTRGVWGQVASFEGAAGVFQNSAGGNLIVGQTGPTGITTNVFRVEGDGDVVSITGDFRALGQGKGLILTSPDGFTCKRLSIDNTGALVTATVSCS